MRAEVEPTYPPFVPQPWAVDALCAQTDPALFFPSPGESTKAAKATCAVCPVRAQCLDYAVTTRQGWGVWGGVSNVEREAMTAAQVIHNEHTGGARGFMLTGGPKSAHLRSGSDGRVTSMNSDGMRAQVIHTEHTGLILPISVLGVKTSEYELTTSAALQQRIEGES